MKGKDQVCLSVVATCLIALAVGSQAKGQILPSSGEIPYPPADLDVIAHPAQVLNVFLPNSGTFPPPPGGYPTILYSTAGIFFESGVFGTAEDLFLESAPLPEIGGEVEDSCAGFLEAALESGWAVVTCGHTGWNSFTTCDQKVDCNSCTTYKFGRMQNGVTHMCASSPPSGCWSPNLWYDPDSDPTRWNDWTLFWGEKEITWARQWISEVGSVLWSLSSSCVVLSGTSTGAIYGSHLAFGPDWSSTWTGTLTSQSKQDPRVAGLVFFDPVSWPAAYLTSSPCPHWPTSTDSMDICATPTTSNCPQVVTDCYNKRGKFINDPPVSILKAGSVSRWIRDVQETVTGRAGEYQIPVFLASGDSDAAAGASGFGRDANDTDYQDDYDRQGVPYGGTPFGSACGSAVACDPDLIYSDINPVLSPGPTTPLRLHDAWFALNMMIDLEIMDAEYGTSFHQDKSALYLHEDANQDFAPTALLSLIDGTYDATPCSSAVGICPLLGRCCGFLNCDLASIIVDWLELEVLSNGRACAPGVTFRNAGTNPDCYRATTAQPGGRMVKMTVYFDHVPDEYETAWIFAYELSGSAILGNGQALLCIPGMNGDILGGLSMQRESSTTGTGSWSVEVPAMAASGTVVYTQVLLADQCVEDAGTTCTPWGMTPHSTFLLSNAQDITLLP